VARAASAHDPARPGHPRCRPTNPFPIPAYEPRAWNYDERARWRVTSGARGAVRAHWNQPEAETRPFFSAYIFLDLVGQHCLGYPRPAAAR
jgi:hypothetical protein